jgi:hypothetical protein
VPSAVSLQSASVTHFTWHLRSSPQSEGAAQSASTRHWWHFPSSRSHAGEATPQSARDAQAEHCARFGSHTGPSLTPAQSRLVVHPTQAPVCTLQVGASDGQATLDVQAAWHLLSPGKHASPAAQSAFVPHSRHFPSTQASFPGSLQSARVAHSVHPSVVVQPAAHLPPPMLHVPAVASLDDELLHAATRMTATARTLDAMLFNFMFSL